LLKLKLVDMYWKTMDGITDDRVERYLYSLLPKSPNILRELELRAEAEHIPIVGPMVGKLLYILASTSKAKHILEIGTAIGYSAIWLGLAAKQNNGMVISIEIDSERANEAMKNIRRARLEKTVRVIHGDGLEVVSKMKKSFDMVFIDDDKKNYPTYLDICLKRLKRNGLLVADNALWGGEVLRKTKSEDARAIARFNELMMKRMRSVIIPARDGVAIGIK
jgi:predicted O-methyltransferase YrrM